MTPPDPAAVREAAKWYSETESPMGKLLADTYLALTDPEPLTVERLVEMGFRKTHRSTCYKLRTVFVHVGQTPWVWLDYFVVDHTEIHPVPRTAGELAMLLAMMEGR